jgi:hypothetical protein
MMGILGFVFTYVGKHISLIFHILVSSWIFLETACLMSYPGSKKKRTEASTRVPRMFNHTRSNNMINR